MLAQWVIIAIPDLLAFPDLLLAEEAGVTLVQLDRLFTWESRPRLRGVDLDRLP